MIVDISLDKNYDGQVLRKGADKGELLKITLEEIKAFEIRTKGGKIANDFAVFHNAADDSFGRRHVVVTQRGHSGTVADIHVHLNEGIYEVKVAPAHMKRALQLRLEISEKRKSLTGKV